MGKANIKTKGNVIHPKPFEFFTPYQSIDKIKKKDLKMLTRAKGIQRLLYQDEVNLDTINTALEQCYYEKVLFKIHAELVKLQNWIIQNHQKVIVIVEGRDAAGKDGAIRELIERLNARNLSVNSLAKPTDEEREMWYFQRYISRFPRPGDICFFNRSWYNRAVVEPVNGFCTTQEYDQFMEDVIEFEKMLVKNGTHLIKIYFSIDYKEQGKRLKEIQDNPLKRWQYTELDSKAQPLWKQYTKYKEVMFEKTSTEVAPWAIIDANNKKNARLTWMQFVLDQFDYQTKQEN